MFKDHETNCPNRILLDSVVYQSEDMVRPVPIIENVPDIDYSTEESWEGVSLLYLYNYLLFYIYFFKFCSSKYIIYIYIKVVLKYKDLNFQWATL